MTAFNPSQLPSNITTLEGVSIWSGQVLQFLYPDLTVVEFPGSVERCCQAAPGYITAAATPNWRHIQRISTQLNPNWQSGGDIWTYPIEFGSLAIPAAFQS